MANDIIITTPLPQDAAGQAVVDLLHRHDLYIQTTCPQLISQKHVSGTPGLDVPCVYEITDKRPIGQTTFNLTLTNVTEGIDALIEGKTPMGSMTLRSTWRVGNGELKEVVEIESNLVTRKLVKGNIEKGHPEYHKYVLQALYAVFTRVASTCSFDPAN
ncbi:hypothetical protein NUW58_g10549 [Xylaria curta]|uniref:Uncharacterized protein n=1 Tax=Xylaria curta TaxID=42375 RepID=A0ACC1MJ39_9PEZI|nr:hypothetical protein NUW58_g10549 [Xylaria curta]